MLLAKDCAHLKAENWSHIFKTILKLEKDEKLLTSLSDEHEGGVTSCMPETRPVIDGCMSVADIVLRSGDENEFESPKEFYEKAEEIKKHYADPYSRGCMDKLHDLAEDILHKKVTDAIAPIRKFLRENPGKQYVEIIGNHENFETYRKALTELEDEFPNFQWMPEVAILPMPGGSKDTGDRLLAVHGDLQMNDLGIVEAGDTDKERPIYTHKKMAQKVVQIATDYWMPSAQKQEGLQFIVDWWRKPKATAKTVYAKLMFRAQQGDKAMKNSGVNLEALAETEVKLIKRRKKFEKFKEELDNRDDVVPQERERAHAIYDHHIATINEELEILQKPRGPLEELAQKLIPDIFKSPKTVLHYKMLGTHEPMLFTTEQLQKITHINYGHTHVPTEGVKIKGLGGKKIIVTNNASVTGATMHRLLDKEGNARDTEPGETPYTDLGNLGMLLYRVKDGKITEIISAGHLLANNLHQVKALIDEVPKTARDAQPRLTGREIRGKLRTIHDYQTLPRPPLPEEPKQERIEGEPRQDLRDRLDTIHRLQPRRR